MRPSDEGVPEVSKGDQNSGVAAKGFVPNGVVDVALTVTTDPLEAPDGELIVKPEAGVKLPPLDPVDNTPPLTPMMCEPIVKILINQAVTLMNCIGA